MGYRDRKYPKTFQRNQEAMNSVCFSHYYTAIFIGSKDNMI